ncbi:hypothetical protein AB0C12_21915 [Actinoplanes sp. NPDC048967]|uniref:hypothetical protein n=1 Tax=Actinoplanes sp. NPDC048967 TaxID=3155269 RepID=UPI003401F382
MTVPRAASGSRGRAAAQPQADVGLLVTRTDGAQFDGGAARVGQGGRTGVSGYVGR